MNDINSVTLTGRLTRDPELKDVADGATVCQFGLACTKTYRDGDEWKERPRFFDVVVWGRRGETCAKYLTKGSAVTVAGELDSRSWEAQDGTRRSKIEVRADTVIFHGTPSRDEEAPF